MSTPRAFLFGQTRFDRNSVPEILSDFEQLPTVDESAFAHRLDIKEAYRSNLEAYRLFVVEKNVSLRQIETLTGVDPKQLYRLFQRVISKASDGRIEGLRGLIPFKHLKVYVREVKVKATSVLFSKNASGAMGQLLRRFPALESWLRKKVKERNRPLRPGEIREVRKSGIPPISRTHS
ncbi:MAG: hypothetical protein V4573_11495 [Pseudomonadota bacterium]